VNNPNIYNVEGDNRLSPGLQSLTTGSVLKILFFFSLGIIKQSLPSYEVNIKLSTLERWFSLGLKPLEKITTLVLIIFDVHLI
jgi:hypothetical protein